MPHLDAQLLGGVVFAIDERELAIRSAKARALLCYLLTTRQIHSRERLAGFLWPDVAERNALASLRTALYDIRHALGGGVALVQVDRTRVFLSDRFTLDLDIARIEAVSPEHGDPDWPTLDAAIHSYRGDFLAGLAVQDSFEFEDWVFLERERLAQLYLSALCQAGQRHGQLGRYDLAVDTTRRALAVDPLREDVHRSLIEALGRSGRRAEAIAQYDSLVKLLHDELGIEPLAGTRELRDLVAADALGAPASTILTGITESAVSRAASLRATPELNREPDLVGREAERAALAAAWKRAEAAAGGLVLLTGEAGIGKSRLLRELASSIQGSVVLQGAGHESAASRAFGPFVEALEGARESGDLDSVALGDVWRRELGRLLPKWSDAGDNPPLDGFRDRDRLFEAFRELFERLAETAPVLALIDDAQWADETSLALLAYLARQLSECRVLLVVAARSGESGVERRAQLRALGAEGQRIALPPLTDSDVSQLVAASGGPSKAPIFARRLRERTGGNPFFALETLLALTRQRTLTGEAGTWATEESLALADYEQLPVPESVHLLVDSRLDRLGDDARTLLDCAAALRRDFAFDLVQDASGLPPGAALDALDQALAEGLLVEIAAAGTARYDFAHALVRERVYGRLSAARRQFLHRQLAGRLEASEEVGAERIAYHYTRGGDRKRAFAWSVRAGATGLALHAAESALLQYETARELAAGPDEEYGAASGLGDALLRLGRGPEAIAAYGDALACAPGIEERAEMHRRIGRVHERSGAYDLALDSYGAASQCLRGRGGSLVSARVADGLATVFVRLGRAEEAVALCNEALEWLLSHPDMPRADEGEAWLRNTLGMAELHAGDHASAVAHLERALHLKRSLGDRLGEATILNNLGVVYYRRGHERVARDYYAASLAVKRDIGDRYGEAIALTNLALMDTRLGDTASAGANLDAARAAVQDVGAAWLVPEIHRVSALRALEVGDVDGALSEAEDSLETAENLGVPAFIGAAHRVLGLVKGLGHAGPTDEHFETSLAVYEMLGDEHELAKTHADYAAALSAEGRLDDAAAHVAVAREIFARTGADGRLARLDSLRN